MRYFFALALMLLSHSLSALEVGAARYAQYLPLLNNQRVSLVVNHTATVGTTHLIDALIARDINVVSIMAPEHGFRGDAAAGATIENGTDVKTGLPVFSLYGKTKKPTPAMLADTDVLIFDIQDVGARFYTYLSTLHYVLEAAAEQGKTVVVLDRPNPNIRYVDGPVLDPDYASFVGMHPIPVLHGMTLGELATMIVGEGWINQSELLRLHVVPVADYTRQTEYVVPIPPSPNLPNQSAIYSYPSLCLFEATTVSVGRGTDRPFQLIGHDKIVLGLQRVSVAPNSAAPTPKLNGTTLYAKDFTPPLSGFDLTPLLMAYRRFADGNAAFFSHSAFFDKLAGTDRLRLAIIGGQNEQQIRQSWQADLKRFKQMRQAYLIYPEES